MRPSILRTPQPARQATPQHKAIEVVPHSHPRRWRATVRMPDGSMAAMHDPGHPWDEARAQVSACAAKDAGVIVIVGAGLGYLTEAARDRFPHARIIVLEPVPQLAAQARRRTPHLYESDRVRLFTGPTYGDADLARSFNLDDPDAPEPQLLLTPALQRAMPAATASAVVLMRRAVAGARMNARARRQNAGRYVVNTLRNLGHVARGFDPARLAGQFVGVPAVLVAAGPSLDRNLPDLRAVASRALIVATDTAWRPLASAGIDPHLVASLDPSTLNGRHLSDVPSARPPWVLAEGSVDPAALATLAERVGVFRVGEHQPWPWLAAQGVGRPLVRVWGSVLTAAFDLSVTLGCDPIVFIGADLAYSDSRPYCRGTAFEHDWARHVAEGTSLRTVWQHTLDARAAVEELDTAGRPVRTAAHLVEFRNWLTAQAGRQTNRRVINATGGGILKGAGIEQADLLSVLGDRVAIDDRLRADLARLCAREPDPAATRALSSALAHIEQSLSDNPSSAASPAADWLAFAGPSLSAGALRGAVQDGRAALDSTDTLQKSRACAEPETPPLKLHEADRVARMRALLSGNDSVLDGCAAVTEAVTSVSASRADALALLERLMSLPALIESTDGQLAPDSRVPMSCRHLWTAAARPLVAAFEERLLDCVDPLRPSAGPADVRTQGGYWHDGIAPVLDDAFETTPQATPAPTDAPIRAALAAHHLTLTATSASGSAEPERIARVAGAIVRAAEDPHLRRSDEHQAGVAIVDGGTTVRLPVRIDGLMRALTGTLSLRAADGGLPGGVARVWPSLSMIATTRTPHPDPRLAFLGRDFAYVEPAVLTDGALSRGYSLASASGARALFVSRGSHSSVWIHEDGTMEAATAWPVAITAEVPWGDAGGALAWNASDATVAFRPKVGSEALVETAPFTPVRAVVGPDGTVFWSARGGAVWRWLPGRGGSKVADAPCWGAILLEGGDLVLPWLERDERGSVRRTRHVSQWRLRRGATEFVSEPGPLEGPCLSTATNVTWSAFAHPHADLIRVERPGLQTVQLACYAPTGVAWAGPSLVVVTGDGSLLVFRHLSEALDRLAPATGGAGR